ncbi:MAG: hypothetical protein HRU19_15870 [Pseudobacteriovorax sp.]|nr:hypothetical protein [Pseudobacteriovorax sp.]
MKLFKVLGLSLGLSSFSAAYAAPVVDCDDGLVEFVESSRPHCSIYATGTQLGTNANIPATLLTGQNYEGVIGVGNTSPFYFSASGSYVLANYKAVQTYGNRINQRWSTQNQMRLHEDTGRVQFRSVTWNSSWVSLTRRSCYRASNGNLLMTAYNSYSRTFLNVVFAKACLH